MEQSKKQEALKEAIDILQEVKVIISGLNKFVIKNELLKVDTVELVEGNPKVTSILQISCECDEQIGELEKFNGET